MTMANDRTKVYGVAVRARRNQRGVARALSRSQRNVCRRRKEGRGSCRQTARTGPTCVATRVGNASKPKGTSDWRLAQATHFC